MNVIVKTLIFLVFILVYVFMIRKLFSLIYKIKKDVGIKFLRSVLMIFGIAIIIFAYLFQFEDLK